MLVDVFCRSVGRLFVALSIFIFFHWWQLSVEAPQKEAWDQDNLEPAQSREQSLVRFDVFAVLGAERDAASLDKAECFDGKHHEQTAEDYFKEQRKHLQRP